MGKSAKDKAVPARLPFAGGSGSATVRLHPLLCGRFRGPRRWFLGPPGWRGTRRALGIGVPAGEMLETPIVAFLVEHPGAGPFLIDSGLHPRVAAAGPARDFGRLTALGFKDLRMAPEQALRTQLTRRGIPPDEIGLIVATHLHADHASGLSEFPGATVVLGRREWEGLGGALDGYNRRQLDAEADYRLLDFDADGTPHAGFGRTLDLFGDGSVIVADTPGHSPGHLSLILRLASGPALLAGDAIFTLGELHGEAEPWRIADRRRYRDSLAQLRRFAAANPRALIVPGHDMAAWQALEAAY